MSAGASANQRRSQVNQGFFKFKFRKKLWENPVPVSKGKVLCGLFNLYRVTLAPGNFASRKLWFCLGFGDITQVERDDEVMKMPFP